MAGRPLRRARLTAIEAARSLSGDSSGDPGLPGKPEAKGGSDASPGVRVEGQRESAPLRNDDDGLPPRSQRQDHNGSMHGDSGGLRSGLNGNGGNNPKRKVEGPTPIGEVVGAMLPILEARYRTEAEETIARASEIGVRGGAGILNKVDAFSDLLSLSIERVTQIMALKPNPTDKDFAKIMSTQQSIAASVFSTAARIDETQLRRQNADKLDEILEIVRQEEDLLRRKPLNATIEGKSTVQ